MRTCIDIIGEIASLFSDADFFVCNDDRSIYPDGSRDSINCIESNDIFFIRDIDTQDMECDVHFHKCRTSDKVKNRNVCSDDATWYIFTEEDYCEDIRYPRYCRRGKVSYYGNYCESDYMENPWCFYPFKRTPKGYGSLSEKGNNCQH
jgi:hypothetical protein